MSERSKICIKERNHEENETIYADQTNGVTRVPVKKKPHGELVSDQNNAHVTKARAQEKKNKSLCWKHVSVMIEKAKVRCQQAFRLGSSKFQYFSLQNFMFDEVLTTL